MCARSMPQHRKKDCKAKAYLSLSVYLYLLVYGQRIELIPSPQQQQPLLPSLLSLSFFYAEPVYISVQLRVEQLPVSDISQIFCLPLQLLYTQDDLTRAGHTRHLLRQSDTVFQG